MDDFPTSPIFVPRDAGADPTRSRYAGSDPGGHDGCVVVPVMNDAGFRVEVFDAGDVGAGPGRHRGEAGHDRAVRAALGVDAPSGRRPPPTAARRNRFSDELDRVGELPDDLAAVARPGRRRPRDRRADPRLTGLRRCSGAEEGHDLGEGGGVLDEEGMAALVAVELGAGDPRGDGLGVPERGQAVEAAAADERGRGDRDRAGPTTSWWLRAASWACSPRTVSASFSTSTRWARASTRAASPGCSASHSGVKRVSSTSVVGPCWCSGNDDPPAPPADVHSSASRSIRSGAVAASSWATMPPKLMPITRQVSQPTWSITARASAAQSAMVKGSSGIVDSPMPRASNVTTSNVPARGWRRIAEPAMVMPEPLSRSRRGPLPSPTPSRSIARSMPSRCARSMTCMLPHSGRSGRPLRGCRPASPRRSDRRRWTPGGSRPRRPPRRTP